MATPSAAASPTPGGSNPAAGIPFPSATDSDPFYAQPSPFPNVPHGTILASRSITYTPNGVAMSNPAWQLKFASQDVYGRAIAAVETAVKSTSPYPGTVPLYVYLFAEDSLGPQCAPSHWAAGSGTDDESGQPSAALANGWTVMYPDLEGPFSLYAAGPQEGYVTLDSIIAALSFAPLGLTSQTPIGMSGYSGGAHAVSFAAAQQRAYAPNLNIVAAASGGTPAGGNAIFTNIDGSSPEQEAANSLFFSILYMSAIGINRAYPDYLTPILNAKGVAAAKAMENGCGGKNSDGSSGPSGVFTDYTSTSNPFGTAAAAAVGKAENQGATGLFPKLPSYYFMYHSITDELIPIAGVDTLNSEWCAQGAKIAYFRDPSGGDHVSTETTNIQNVETYLAERFEGLAPTFPAGTTTCN